MILKHPRRNLPRRGDRVVFDSGEMSGIVQEVCPRPPDPIRGKMLLIRILMGPRAGNVTTRGHFEVEHG